MEDASGSMDVFVEISLVGKAKTTATAQATFITAASQQEVSLCSPRLAWLDASSGAQNSKPWGLTNPLAGSQPG